MAYLDSTYLNDALGSAVVTALCPSSDVLSRVIAQASAKVDAALKMGGYELTSAEPIANVPEIVKLAAMGQFVKLAYGRHGRVPPEAYSEDINLLAGFRDGTIEITGFTQSTVRAVGGHTFSDTSETSDTGKPLVFRRDRMRGF